MATVDVAAGRLGGGAGARSRALSRNARTVAMVWERELIRFRRSQARIVTGLAQPLLFLVVLGAGLSKFIGSRGAAGVSYQQYLLPGVIAMSVLFSSLFSAISIVWDREFGFLREMLVAPVSRTALVLGKAVGGGTVSILQGIVLLVAAPFVGVHLTILNVAEMIALLMALSFGLVSFGIVVASRIQRIESFQVVMSLVVNPMLFLSGAIFPLQRLPGWLGVAVKVNPATYGVDPIRRVILGDRGALTIGGGIVPIWAEVLIVLAMGTAMLALAVRSFRRTE
jgi:ABC-2 type transport system permease protein